MAALPKIVIVELSGDDLGHLIQTAVIEGVKAALREAGSGNGHERQLLNRSQLAERLQLSKSQISKMVERGLPCLGKGREKRFRVSEVEEWMKTDNAPMLP